jgi:hypothetical protein
MKTSIVLHLHTTEAGPEMEERKTVSFRDESKSLRAWITERKKLYRNVTLDYRMEKTIPKIISELL